jgi:hypothetical protein
MLEFKKQLITPTIAKQYLEANVFNRRVKAPVVYRYANDMANGKWKEDTAELIKVSKTGVILDGQHRLMAIIKANVSLYLHFAIGLEDTVFDVLDTGSTRNATDTFKVKNIKHENSIPAIISMYNLLNNGHKPNTHKVRNTNADLLNQYFLDENFWQNVARQSHNWYLSFAKILPPSFIGGFYALFVNINKDKADEFMKQLTTGVAIENEVVNMLRNKLMQDKMSPRKMPSTLKMALIIKAWNVFVKNQTIKMLKFDTIRDEFPTATNNY